jgi:hypothetical protein
MCLSAGPHGMCVGPVGMQGPYRVQRRKGPCWARSSERHRRDVVELAQAAYGTLTG